MCTIVSNHHWSQTAPPAGLRTGRCFSSWCQCRDPANAQKPGCQLLEGKNTFWFMSQTFSYFCVLHGTCVRLLHHSSHSHVWKKYVFTDLKPSHTENSLFPQASSSKYIAARCCLSTPYQRKHLISTIKHGGGRACFFSHRAWAPCSHSVDHELVCIAKYCKVAVMGP